MMGDLRWGRLGIVALLPLFGCGDDGGDSSDEPGMSSSTSPSATATTSEPMSSTSDGLPSDSTSTPSSTTTAASMGDETSTGPSSSDGSDDTQGVEGPRVLMLGNSYTQFNDLAAMVTALSYDVGMPLHVEAITQGGATAADLLGRPDVQATLADDGWDFVTIQGQSYEPLIQPVVFEDAAIDLADLVIAGGGHPVMFETWARAAGHPLYDEPWSGGDPQGMQAGLHDAYAGVAVATEGTLAPIGQGWERSLADAPAIVLHSADGSHPSVEGSYLAAAVIVGAITEVPVTGSGWWPRSMSAEDATALQQHADAAIAARAR